MKERFQFDPTINNTQNTDFVDSMRYRMNSSIYRELEKKKRETILEALQVEDIEFIEVKN